MHEDQSSSLCGRGKSSLPWQSLSHKPIKFWIHGLIPHLKGHTSGEGCIGDHNLIPYPLGSFKSTLRHPLLYLQPTPPFPAQLHSLFRALPFIFFLPLFLCPLPPSDVLPNLRIHHMYRLVTVLPWLDHKLPKKDLCLLCLLMHLRYQEMPKCIIILNYNEHTWSKSFITQ